MAKRLLGAGHSVVVYDIDDTAVAEAVTAGAYPAASSRAVGDIAETILLSLSTPPVVQSVVLGRNGVSAGATVRRVVSTSGIPATQSLASSLIERGIELIDSPVSGGTAGARAGTLALMVACPAGGFDELANTLAPLGQAMKLWWTRDKSRRAGTTTARWLRSSGGWSTCTCAKSCHWI